MSEHRRGCGINCRCEFDSPLCRVCNCGVAERDRVSEIATELLSIATIRLRTDAEGTAGVSGRNGKFSTHRGDRGGSDE